MDESLIGLLSEGEILYDKRTGDVVEVLSAISENSNWILVKALDDESTNSLTADNLRHWDIVDLETMFKKNPKLKAIVKVLLWRLDMSEDVVNEIVTALSGKA